MSSKPEGIRILVVEDDEFVLGLLCAVLDGAEFEAVGAGSIAAMAAAREQASFNILLLDLGLPDGDGLDVLRDIRSSDDPVPVVVLTSRADIDARLTALESGADDYITKPVDPRELLLRIRRLVDHEQTAGRGESGERFVHGPWTVDIGQRSVSHHERGELTLTRSEFDLLAALFQSPGRVLSRDVLLNALEREDGGPYDRTIDVLVSRLRKKLGESARRSDLIQTVQGVGYKLIKASG